MGFKQFLTNNWRLVNSNNLFINRCMNSVLESQNTGYAKKVSVENTLQLPLKPKKPSPPFFKFLNEKRPEVVQKHNLSLKDAVRVVSEMWKNIDAGSKEKMNSIFNKELEKYKDSMKMYKQSLTDDQKTILSQMKYEQMEQKIKRKHRKELKELGKPRKPLTAYLMFVSDEIKNHGNVSVIQYMPIVASKWKELDDSTKTKYINAATKEHDKYIKELTKWEDDMIKAGRFDLVRARAIPDENTNDN